MRTHAPTFMHTHACACMRMRTQMQNKRWTPTNSTPRPQMDGLLADAERERERGCTKHRQAQLKQPFCHDNVWKALAGTIKSAKIEEKVLIQDQSLAFKPYKCQRFQVVMCWKCITIAGFKKKIKILVDLYRFRIVSQFSIRFQLRDGAGRSDCDSFSSDFVVWDVILDAF